MLTEVFDITQCAQKNGRLRHILASRWPYLVVRVVLGLIFIYAGAMKLMDPKAFARIISHYDLIPEGLLPVVAVGLPLAEVLAGIALLFDLSAGLHGISGMVVLFILVLGYGVATGMDIDCGCFGEKELAEQKGLLHAFYRDLLFLGGVIFLYLSRFVRGRRLADGAAKNTSN
jgi:uncharacterized membrane protein YphA (DoxX/SURF4 family)